VETPVDVRVVAATNKDPQSAVASGELRGDLYYRLNVFNIQMPPLREHLMDVSAIAEKMIDDMNERHNCSVAGVKDSLMMRLEGYGWPGNVRELRNTIERAVIMAGAGMLGVEHLPPHFGEPGFAPPPTRNGGMAGHSMEQTGPSSEVQRYLDEANSVRVEVGTTVDEAERQLILKTLISTHNNKTKAAEILGISSKTLQNKLKEYSNTSASVTE
jgi:DNA-binding NtrC family response regulator